MFDDLPAIVGEVLFYERAPVGQTEVFQYFKHNANLCPTAERQLARALQSFEKNRAVAYDIQGLRDRGTDVVLRYNPNPASDESVNRYICLQIKSYHDMERSGLIKDLKAQYFDTKSEHGPALDHYYLLLATDRSAHTQKIRDIKAEFTNASNVTIADPSFCLTFFHLSTTEITRITDSFLHSSDPVRDQASDLMEGLTPSQACILLLCIWQQSIAGAVSVSVNRLRSNLLLKDIYGLVDPVPTQDGVAEGVIDWARSLEGLSHDERINRDLEVLDGKGLEVDSVSGETDTDLLSFLPVEAIMLDAHVRYGFSGDALVGYVFDSLKVLRRFEITVSTRNPEDDGMIDLDRAAQS